MPEAVALFCARGMPQNGVLQNRGHSPPKEGSAAIPPPTLQGFCSESRFALKLKELKPTKLELPTAI
jgi:hypothetical protein